MIITVSLNPSIDRTLAVERFEYGSMNRVQNARDDACGKAVNLAIVAGTLGAQAVCVGLLPEDGGARIERRLEAHGVETRFIHVPGRVRVNIKLLDQAKRVITEINERGETATEAQLSELGELISARAGPGDFLVLTGSMPPGCPQSAYETMIRAAPQGVRCVLDAEGDPLRLAIRAKPFLIKPNRLELEQLLGKKLDSIEQVREAAHGLIQSGVSLVAVTLGPEGALLTDGEQTLFAPPIRLQARSTVGAGDSMLAGLLTGFSRGEALERAFRMGVAAASASVVSEGTRLVDADTYGQMLNDSKVVKI